MPVRPLVVHSRREFCAYAASAIAAGSLAACGGSPTAPSSSPSDAAQLTAVNGSVSGRIVSVNVDSASALSTVGSAALVQSSLGSFLVTRTAQESFSALTAVCTHEGCTVTGFTASQFVCPCHGSRYTTSGTVVNGPAQRPLQQYATQFAGGILTFTV